MREEPFSQRRGLGPVDVPITLRNEAPTWFRDFIVTAAQDANMSMEDLRDILCVRLLESANHDNWSSGNLKHEIRGLLSKADWFQVYDFCEDIANWFRERGRAEDLWEFSRRLNDSFERKGIGWKLVGCTIETRGDESFEVAVRSAISITSEMNKPVAQKELHEALHDLSKRPDPDITGAIQHAMAALECVARTVTGNENDTLGALLKKNAGMFPPPLGVAVDKIWGFSSERGRHLRENDSPAIEEAEFVVGLVGTLVTYLLKKFPNTTSA